MRPTGDEEPELEGAVAMTTRVLADRRLPESAVTRTFGSAELAAGVVVSCSTNFAARRAEVAALVQPDGKPTLPVLGGPLPQRGPTTPVTRVEVRSVQAED